MQRKKIDDNKLVKMLKTGKTQKEAADFFKVSPVAVCKRLKRLLPQPEAILDRHNLTDKEKCFVIEKAKGKTNTQAVLSSYEVSSMNSAKVIGSQLMDKPEIKMAINELMDYHGLTRSYRIKKLKQHVDNNDPVVSLKALDMSLKLANEYPVNKNVTAPPQISFTQVNIDYLNKINEDENE